MNTNFKTALFGGALLLALGGGAVAPALADDDDHDDAAKMEAIVKAGKFISPDEAREKALAAKPGSVIDVDLERSWRSGYHYEVEIIDAEMKEWEVHIDAKSGKVTSVERDWFD
ncbi:MAG: PepSY domain-containing protein [Betaproteobacteria bacterium]